MVLLHTCNTNKTAEEPADAVTCNAERQALVTHVLCCQLDTAINNMAALLAVHLTSNDL